MERIVRGQTFGEKCKYVVVRHRCTFTEKDGKTTIVNLFVSKEVDAEFNKNGSDDKVLIDLKVFAYCKLWNNDSLRYQLLRCSIMDFLVDGFVYVVGLRQRIPKDKRTRAWKDKDQFYQRIDKVVILEKISALCKSEDRKKFITELPAFLHKLVKTFYMDRPTTIIRCADLYKGAKIFLKYGDGSKRQLLEVNNEKEPPVVKYGKFEPCRHHLVIIGTAAEQINVKTPFCHGDCCTVETFCCRYFAGFQYKPKNISIYGTPEEIAKVMNVLTEAEKNITSTIIYNPSTQKREP